MPLSRALSQLPSTETRVISAMVGRGSKSPLHSPYLCEALGMPPHSSTCLRWQRTIAILSAFLQPGQQKGGKSISTMGSPTCCGVVVPLDFALHFWDRLRPQCSTKPQLSKCHHTSLFSTLTLESLLTCANQ